MSDPDQNRDGSDQGQPTGRSAESGRRRARVLIPIGIVLVVAALIIYMLVINRLGQEEGSERSGENGSAPVSLLVGAPAGPLG